MNGNESSKNIMLTTRGRTADEAVFLSVQCLLTRLNIKGTEIQICRKLILLFSDNRDLTVTAKQEARKGAESRPLPQKHWRGPQTTCRRPNTSS